MRSPTSSVGNAPRSRRANRDSAVDVDDHGSAAAAAIPASSESRLAGHALGGGAGVSNRRGTGRRAWRARSRASCSIGSTRSKPVSRDGKLDVVGVEVVARAARVGGVEMRQVQRARARVAVDREVGVRHLDAGEVVHLVRLAEQHHAARQRCAGDHGDVPRSDRRWRPPPVARRVERERSCCWNRRGSGSSPLSSSLPWLAITAMLNLHEVASPGTVAAGRSSKRSPAASVDRRHRPVGDDLGSVSEHHAERVGGDQAQRAVDGRDDGRVGEPMVVPAHVEDEPAAEAQAADRAGCPRRRERRQEADDTAIGLDDHLGDRCRRPEVAIDLERDVRVGAARRVGRQQAAYVQAASMPWSDSRARSPSPRRADTSAAQERLHEPFGVLLASRCCNDLVIAAISAGSPSTIS